MLNLSATYVDSFKSSKDTPRKIKGYVTYSIDGTSYKIEGNPEAQGNLVNFKIERTVPSGKLFGFAVSQQLTIEAIGIIDIPKGTRLLPVISIETETPLSKLPYFYVDTVEINKVNKTTTIVAYDALKSSNKTIGELGIAYPVNTADLAQLLAQTLGMQAVFYGLNFEITAGNFQGTETIHSALNSLAEATGTICFVRYDNTLMFSAVSANAASVAELTADHYFDFSIGDKIQVSRLVSATELGDNVGYGGTTGRVVTFWENPLLTLLDNNEVYANLMDLGDRLIGLPAEAYDLTWRGCPAFEIGDRITVIDKDGVEHLIYYLNETLTYDGGLKAVSFCDVGQEENEHGTASSAGKLLSQTYAKVDKANQKIELVVQETEELQSSVSSLEMNTEGIRMDVQQVTMRNEEAIDSLTDNISSLTERVSMSMDQSQVQLMIEKTIDEGVTGSITTTTGFTFDEVGLTVSKTGSEMTTLIDEDGMTVYRDNQEVLIADSTGVDATNLRASTFLIIGDQSRFENYTDRNGIVRTGCFWLAD